MTAQVAATGTGHPEGVTPIDHPVTFTMIAEALGVTPNQVWTWHERRERNNFPEAVASVHKPQRGGRRKAPLFDLDAVLDWYEHYDKYAMSGSHWADKAKKPVCGTERGYQAHRFQYRKRGTGVWPLPKDDPCGCKAAHATYEREKKAQRGT